MQSARVMIAYRIAIAAKLGLYKHRIEKRRQKTNSVCIISGNWLSVYENGVIYSVKGEDGIRHGMSWDEADIWLKDSYYPVLVDLWKNACERMDKNMQNGNYEQGKLMAISIWPNVSQGKSLDEWLSTLGLADGSDEKLFQAKHINQLIEQPYREYIKLMSFARNVYGSYRYVRVARKILEVLQ